MKNRGHISEYCIENESHEIVVGCGSVYYSERKLPGVAPCSTSLILSCGMLRQPLLVARRLSSTTAARKRRRGRSLGTAALTAGAVGVAVTLLPRLAQDPRSSDALLMMRMSALLGVVLVDRERALRHHTAQPTSSGDDVISSGGSSSTLWTPPPDVQDALAAATQLLQTLINSFTDADAALLTRVTERLADAATDASAGSSEQLRRLTDRGLVDALLQFIAHAHAADDTVLQSAYAVWSTLIILRLREKTART